MTQPVQTRPSGLVQPRIAFLSDRVDRSCWLTFVPSSSSAVARVSVIATMAVTDHYHTSSSSRFAYLSRSILGGGGGSGSGYDVEVDRELETFQQHVADLFRGLCGWSGDADEVDVLSLTWIQKLLETFIVCQQEFGLILSERKSLLSRASVNRLVTDHYERTVKALDVCNAIRDGIDQVRDWVKHLEIVRLALDYNTQGRVGSGQFRRAKKALTDLTITMLDGKNDSSLSPNLSGGGHRNRSFGKNTKDRDINGPQSSNHLRSQSWSVSRNWSAVRQLKEIGNNLGQPRSNDMVATNGLALAVFTMNCVLVFVIWALVAAIPCQDRGLQTDFSVPRGFVWAAPVAALQQSILEESKKRDRKKNSNGLLREIHRIEKCARHLSALVDDPPLSEEKVFEVKEEMIELTEVCDTLKKGLDELEMQVRVVFCRIVRSRRTHGGAGNLE